MVADSMTIRSAPYPVPPIPEEKQHIIMEEFRGFVAEAKLARLALNKFDDNGGEDGVESTT